MTERRWLVTVDDTPVLPEHPLALDLAIATFRFYVNGGEDKVEIRQISESKAS